MSLQRQQGDYPAAARQRPWRVAAVRLLRWRLRWRLRLLTARIQTLEQHLGAEFALQETAPLHEELAQLNCLREALQQQWRDLA